MKFLFSLIATAALLLGSAVAQAAGSVTNVTVVEIQAQPSGLFFIYFSSPPSGGPACAASGTGFIVDGSTKGGAPVVSLAEIAYTMGKTVNASGDGTCSIKSNWETIASINTTD